MDTSTLGSERFRSASELRARHTQLLARWADLEDHSESIPEAFTTDVDDFLKRARRTGAILSDPAIRSDCQTYVNYWATRLSRAEGQSRSIVVLLPHNPSAEAEVGAELAKQASAVFEPLAETERDAARRLFLQLVRPGSRGSIRTLEVPEDRLLSAAGPNAAPVLKKLIDAELVRATTCDANEPRNIELAHEGLARHWKPLAEWVAAERQRFDQREAFRAAAQVWDRENRPVDRLLTIDHLLQDRTDVDDLSQVERDFLKDSQDEITRRRQAQADQASRLLDEKTAHGKTEAELKAEQATRAQKEAELKAEQAALAQKEAELKAEEARRQEEYLLRRRWKLAAYGLILMSVALVVAVVFAVTGYRSARQATRGAEKAEEVAKLARDAAMEQQKLAEQRKRLAELDKLAADELGPGRLGKGQTALLQKALAWWDTVETELAAPNSEARDFVWLRHLVRQSLHRELDGWQERAVIRAHHGTIWDAAFSPDGRFLASASADSTVVLWRVPVGRQQWTERQVFADGHTKPINALAFRPDGKKLSTAGDDGQVIIWDVEKSTADLKGWKPHGDEEVWGVAYGSTFLATCGPDSKGPVRLWRLRGVETPEPVPLTGAQTDAVIRVAFDPAEKLFACGSKDGTVKVWSLADPSAEPTPIPAQSDWVFSLVFHPSEPRIATGSRDGTVRVWDLKTSTPQLRFVRSGADWVNRVAFSPEKDGRLLATAGDDNTVRVWDLESGQEIFRFGEGGGGLNALGFSPDGKRIVAGGAGRLDTQNRERGPAEFGLWVWAVAPSWEWTTFNQLRGRVRSVAFDATGGLLAAGTASPNSRTRVWNVSERSASPLENPGVLTGFPIAFRAKGWTFWNDERVPVNALKFSSSRSELFAAFDDGSIQAVDPGNGKELCLHREAHKGPINCLVVSGNGKRLATAGDDRTIRVWDSSALTQIADLGDASGKLPISHGNRATGVAFLNDAGTELLSVGSDRKALIWSDGKPPTELLPDGEQRFSKLNSVAVDPAARWAAIARDDGIVELWDFKVRPPTLKKKLAVGLGGQALAAAFRPDAQAMAAAGSDGVVYLWDLRELSQPPLILTGHRGAVYSLAFSPDGKRLASGGFDQTVRVHVVDDQMLVELARMRLSAPAK